MSATFRLASKKKVSQDDLRRLMSEHKGKQSSVKVTNPLAKYNDAGQLTCVLCKTVVRSENVWHVHINAKQHKENVIVAKQLKLQTNNFTVPVKNQPLKRLTTSPSNDIPQKKIKGILKNAPPVVNDVPSDFFETKNIVESAPGASMFHNEEIIRPPLKIEQAPEILDNQEVRKGNIDEQPIPEGFFDDPVLDAKARNIEYKDPIEEEWDKFQKEMRDEATTSAAIIAGEQDEATAERQIDEIDEQIRNWSRVLDLEVKTEATKQKLEVQKMSTDKFDNTTDSDSDYDEYLDWRAKKSYS